MTNAFAAARRRAGLSIDEVAKLTGYRERTIYRWERGDSRPKQSVLADIHRLPVGFREAAAGVSASFTFIDLFAGIGGMRLGFQQAGGRCVFTSEWDSFCQQTYRANFGSEHEIAGDIRAVRPKDIPDHDVLVAGFPCQPFSIAGVSKKNALGQPHGFDCETQGTLFFEVERIIREHRPKAFLLENVKNLARHDSGRTFEVIHRTLTRRLGYHVDWRVIDAGPFVPQHRERVFIVGFRDQTDFSFDGLSFPTEKSWPTLGDVLHPEDGSEPAELPYTSGPSGRVALKYTLTDHLWGYLQDYKRKHEAKGNGFGFGIVGPEKTARTLSARYFKDGSEILVRQGGRNPRRLTPRECARLMGFDPLLGSASAATRRFKIPVSDTQAYKQFGNAVVPPVVAVIARLMEPLVTGASVAPPIRRRLAV